MDKDISKQFKTITTYQLAEIQLLRDSLLELRKLNRKEVKWQQ